MLTLVLVVIFAALVFEFINGFHDTANSIATVVATKVLSPAQAVMLAAGMNLIGALMGTAVAKTIASGLVDTDVVAGHLAGDPVRAAGRHRLEPDHLVAGPAVVVLARADRRPVRRGAGRGAQQLGRADLVEDRRRLDTEQGPAVEGGRADDQFAAGRASCSASWSWWLLWAIIAGHGAGGRPAGAPGAAALGQHVLRQGADRVGGLHGLRARHQRRAEDHGHHRPDPVRRRRPPARSTTCRRWLAFLHPGNARRAATSTPGSC